MKKYFLFMAVLFLVIIQTGCSGLTHESMYSVNFENDGTLLSSQEVKENEKITKPTNPSKEGFIFKGWYLEDKEWKFESDVVINNITLQAKYEKKKFEVIFKDYDDRVLDTKIIEYEEKIPKIADPSREEYAFIGFYVDGKEWNFDEDVVTKDIVLKAEYGKFFNLSDDKTTIISLTELGKSQTNIIVPNYVTTISYEAFMEATSLVSITIPNTVTSIGEYVFYSCTALETVVLSANIKIIEDNLFDNCTSLVNINIPKGVIEINDAAFSGCTSLENITLPDSITEIGESAFSSCDHLKEINIPNKLTKIEKYVFLHCEALESLIIPQSVVEIKEEAFAYCSSLKNITIPENIERIEEKAFLDCDSLDFENVDDVNYLGNLVVSVSNTNKTTYKIKDGTVKILSNAFQDCPNLIEMNLPEGLEYIGKHAFSGCNQLITINIPDSVKYVGYEAFDGCYSLEYEEVDNVNYLNNWVMSYVIKSSTYELKETTVGISYSAFEECTILEIITIPESVRFIGDFAFDHCTSLTSITIPENVQELGECAFAWCELITWFTVPSSVKKLVTMPFINVLL